MSAVVVEWAGETIELLPERAAHWPAQRALIIADPHFGKGATFRRGGVPVPGGTAESDLARLARLVARHRPRRVIVLGDFFHARSGADGETLDALRAWRHDHEGLDVLNVRGNHDRHAGDPPADLAIACVDEPHGDGPFQLRHHPPTPFAAAGFVLAGHLHPAVRLHDVDGTSMRMRCFFVRRSVAVLPAFGGFTGNAIVRPRAGDEVYGIGPDTVVDLRRATTR